MTKKEKNRTSRGNQLIQGLKTIPKERFTTGNNLEKYNKNVEALSKKFLLDSQKSELSVYHGIKQKL